jgi:hypothetical protein
MILTLARKPFTASVTSNILSNGLGCLNINACRIKVDPNIDDMLRTVDRQERISPTWREGSGMKNENNHLTGVRPEGRWPSNVLLVHTKDCSLLGQQQVRTRKDERPAIDEGRIDRTNWRIRPTPQTTRGFGNTEGLETTNVWACASNCPILELDKQSGVSLSSGGINGETLGKRVFGKYKNEIAHPNAGGLGDKGGASRYFKQITNP